MNRAQGRERRARRGMRQGTRAKTVGVIARSVADAAAVLPAITQRQTEGVVRHARLRPGRSDHLTPGERYLTSGA